MKRNNVKKVAAVLLAVIMVVGCSIGATVAYLQMKTAPIQNTFTTSDVFIELTETEPSARNQIKMVPGAVITKNPTVKVSANSEDCYVFVKIDVANNDNDGVAYIPYDVNEKNGDTGVWTKLDGVANVYYCVADSNGNKNVPLGVLANNQVTVNPAVTRADMEAANGKLPTMTFTAYAIQKNYLVKNNTKVETAAGAWELVKGIQ